MRLDDLPIELLCNIASHCLDQFCGSIYVHDAIELNDVLRAFSVSRPLREALRQAFCLQYCLTVIPSMLMHHPHCDADSCSCHQSGRNLMNPYLEDIANDMTALIVNIKLSEVPGSFYVPDRVRYDDEVLAAVEFIGKVKKWFPKLQKLWVVVYMEVTSDDLYCGKDDALGIADDLCGIIGTIRDAGVAESWIWHEWPCGFEGTFKEGSTVRQVAEAVYLEQRFHTLDLACFDDDDEDDDMEWCEDLIGSEDMRPGKVAWKINTCGDDAADAWTCRHKEDEYDIDDMAA